MGHWRTQPRDELGRWDEVGASREARPLDAARMEQIREESLRAMEEDEASGQYYFDYGWRYVENTPGVGTRLDRSHSRDDFGNSLGELRGTSTFDTVEKVAAYARFNNYGAIVLVRGNHAGWGDLAGERLIDDAEVRAVWPIGP